MMSVTILMDAVNRTLRPMAYIVAGFGCFVALLGLILIHYGNAGITTLSVFGQRVNTSSVGVATIALGCTVVSTLVMRIIGIMGRAMDRILSRKDLFEEKERDLRLDRKAHSK